MHCHLIRHPEPDIATGTCYGQLDIPLSMTGLEQQTCLIEWAKTQTVERVYTSPLVRCQSLAKALTQDACPLHSVAAFKEFDFGSWEGKKWDQICRTEIDAWQQDLLHYRIPNGESLDAFHQRVISAWHKLVDKHQGQNIVVITHAGVIRSIVAHELNLMVSESIKIALDYASISQLSVEGEFKRLNFLNRTL